MQMRKRDTFRGSIYYKLARCFEFECYVTHQSLIKPYLNNIFVLMSSKLKFLKLCSPSKLHLHGTHIEYLLLLFFFYYY